MHINIYNTLIITYIYLALIIILTSRLYWVSLFTHYCTLTRVRLLYRVFLLIRVYLLYRVSYLLGYTYFIEYTTLWNKLSY